MSTEMRITKEDLQELLTAAVAAAKSMNPIEQKKFDEEMAKDARKNAMMLSLGKIEEEAIKNKKNACSHMIDSKGNSVGKGQFGGIWNLSGQLHGDGTITLICQRCSTTWHFEATAAEREYASNAEHGLLNSAPPDEKRLIVN